MNKKALTILLPITGFVFFTAPVPVAAQVVVSGDLFLGTVVLVKLLAAAALFVVFAVIVHAAFNMTTTLGSADAARAARGLLYRALVAAVIAAIVFAIADAAPDIAAAL